MIMFSMYVINDMMVYNHLYNQFITQFKKLHIFTKYFDTIVIIQSFNTHSHCLVGWGGHRFLLVRPSYTGVRGALLRRHVIIRDKIHIINGTNQLLVNDDFILEFNPQTNMKLQYIVVVGIGHKEIESNLVSFNIGKVLEVGKEQQEKNMKLCWYWPIAKVGIVDQSPRSYIK